MSKMKLKVDLFYSDLNIKRAMNYMSWRELASKLGLSPSTFSRMADGKSPDVDTFLTCIHWLKASVNTYIEGVDVDDGKTPEKNLESRVSRIEKVMRERGWEL